MTEAFQNEPEISINDQKSTGMLLKQERESKGYSIEDTAARLSISAKYIEALENSDINSLPRLPFVRGYIRSYARFLGMSGDALIVSFNQEFDPQEIRNVATINKVGSQVKLSDPWIRFSVYLFFLAVLGTSVWWWQTQSGNSLMELINFKQNETTESVEQSTPISPVVADQAAAINDPTDIQARLAAREQQLELQNSESNDVEIESVKSSAVEVGTSAEQEPQYLSAEKIAQLTQELEKKRAASDLVEEVGEGAVTIVDTSAENSEVTEKVSEETAVVAEAALPEPVEKPSGLLRISFVSDCWISIRDAGDKLIFANTRRAGDVLELKLDTPANLLVGRVSAVQDAQFNGQDLDLPNHSNKDVARILLK